MLANNTTISDFLRLVVSILLVIYSLCLGIVVAELVFKSKVSEPRHDKTNKMSVRPCEDSDQPGHPPSLIRVCAVRSMGS